MSLGIHVISVSLFQSHAHSKSPVTVMVGGLKSRRISQPHCRSSVLIVANADCRFRQMQITSYSESVSHFSTIIVYLSTIIYCERKRTILLIAILFLKNKKPTRNQKKPTKLPILCSLFGSANRLQNAVYIPVPVQIRRFRSHS